VGLFLVIPPKEVANPIFAEKEQTETFDNKFKELKNKGFNILEIARPMKVHHQIVSNVLKGVYEVNKSQGVKHRTSKWNWEKIDQECSIRLPNLIKGLRKKGYQ
jgi:orotate phosphoribosyltransferase-like protein